MGATEIKTQLSGSVAGRRTRSPVSGLKAVTRRLSDGRRVTYFYHRATGKRVESDPNSAAGLLEIKRLDDLAARRAARSIKEGSLAEIVESYRSDSAVSAGRIKPFRRLKPRTQADYREVFDYLGEHMDSLFPAELRPRHVQKLVDDAAESMGWAFGDKLLSVLRLVINWGLFHEKFEPHGEDGIPWSHPCKDVAAPRRDEGAAQANRPWADDERVAIVSTATLEFLTVYALCLYGQMNVADAIAIPKTSRVSVCLEDGRQVERIRWKRAKNAQTIEIDIEGPLRAFLNAAPAHGAPTIAANTRGKPWTYSGIDSARKRLLVELERRGKVGDGLTFHGLRVTFASIAAEGGKSNKEIAAGLNDRSDSMGERYARGAARERLAQAARKPLFERDEGLISPVLAARLENRMENGAQVLKLAPKKLR